MRRTGWPPGARPTASTTGSGTCPPAERADAGPRPGGRRSRGALRLADRGRHLRRRPRTCWAVLAEAVAARQWEPVTGPRVAALRLWARGWRAAALPLPGDPRPVDRHGCRCRQRRPPHGRPTPRPYRSRTRDDPRPCPAAGRLLPLRHPRLRRDPDGGAPAVLVTGAGGPAGVAVIRRLVALGHRVVAADADPRPPGARWPPWASTVPRGDHPRFVDALLGGRGRPRGGRTGLHRRRGAAAADRRRRSAGRGRHRQLAAGPRPRCDLCCDKGAFAERMAAAGVPHPATATAADAVADVPGPWVVKPRSGRGSRGRAAAGRRAEVAAALAGRCPTSSRRPGWPAGSSPPTPSSTATGGCSSSSRGGGTRPRPASR